MNTITKPTLIVDEQKARCNIAKMAEKAKKSRTVFRPHFKTHHSASVGNWFRDYGITSITVSSVSMAAYFAKNGWQDITIAFPYNPTEWPQVNELAGKIKLNVLVVSPEAISHLNQHLTNNVGYFIKIDCGYHRTGVDPENPELIQKMVSMSSTKVQFKGLLTHAGHSYKSRSHGEILDCYQSSITTFFRSADHLAHRPYLSFGDTPCASVIDSFEGLDELRCGNFVYYDLTQTVISSCNLDEIAVSVACPVVAIHENRNEAIIYGGGVHFSKDTLQMGGRNIYGKSVTLEPDGRWWHDGKYTIKSLSQEHGIIEYSSGNAPGLGDILLFLPVHSCLTAQLLSQQQTTTGVLLDKMSY